MFVNSRGWFIGAPRNASGQCQLNCLVCTPTASTWPNAAGIQSNIRNSARRHCPRVIHTVSPFVLILQPDGIYTASASLINSNPWAAWTISLTCFAFAFLTFYIAQWRFAEKTTLHWCFIRGAYLTPSFRMKNRVSSLCYTKIHRQVIVLSDPLRQWGVIILVLTVTLPWPRNLTKTYNDIKYLLRDLFLEDQRIYFIAAIQP